MKRIILILIVSTFAFASNAQLVTMKGSSHNLATDTLTNTGTIYMTTPILSTQTSGKYVIQLNAVNKTGTSTITAILQSSGDNTNWTNHFKTPGQDGVNCDTLAISGTTTHTWNILPGVKKNYPAGSVINYESASGRRLYFRVKLIGGATQSTQVTAIEYPQ